MTTDLSTSDAPGDAASQTTERAALELIGSDGATYALRGVVEIGRSARISIADRRLSRAHFELTTSRGGHELRDLHSRNGTFVNGRRVESARLCFGDVIRAGDSVFVYTLRAAGPVADGGEIRGTSAAIAETVRALSRLGPTDVSVLLEGETGTGKELAAHALHRLSGRSGPLIATNVGAMPDALFESELFGHVRGAFTGAATDQRGLMVAAHGGTLFLDEIGELGLTLQVKLLRALETRRIRPVGASREVSCDVRIIAATNARLAEAVAANRFRADLYARLAEATLRLPRLRARAEDIPALAGHFHESATSRPMPAWSADFTEALCLHDWPMNVRELRALVRRLAALHPDVPRWTSSLLPAELAERVTRREVAPGPEASGRSTAPLEAAAVHELLRATGGNVRRAALAAGEERTRFYRRLRELAIDPRAYRGGAGEASE